MLYVIKKVFLSSKIETTFTDSGIVFQNKDAGMKISASDAVG